jgi:hypothetical protein
LQELHNKLVSSDRLPSLPRICCTLIDDHDYYGENIVYDAEEAPVAAAGAVHFCVVFHAGHVSGKQAPC